MIDKRLSADYPCTEAYRKKEVAAAWMEAYASGNDWSIAVFNMDVERYHAACCGLNVYPIDTPRYLVREMWGLSGKDTDTVPHSRIIGRQYNYWRVEQSDDLNHALDIFRSWVEARHSQQHEH